MREALTSFEAELDKLGRYLDASEAEDELIAGVLALGETDRAPFDASLSIIQANSTTKRRQNYVSSIIVLYGALERFIEDAVAEYTQTLGDIYRDYGELPEELRSHHAALTIEYLALLKDGKVRETETVETIVSNLHECFSGTASFRLNARAFSLRSANMKLERVWSIMRNLGISLTAKRVVSTSIYAKFLSETQGLSVPERQQGKTEGLLDHIEELVALRNDIAHGVANLSEIEEVEIVRERAAKLRAFVGAINDILFCELLSAQISLDYFFAVRGQIHVFGDHIVGFAWPSGRLAPGDMLIMRPADQAAELRHGPILSIQIDKRDYSEVEGHDGLMIGAKVAFKAKANGTFFVWPRGMMRSSHI